MQKLLAYPVVARLLFIFGIVMVQLGYGTLKRGSIEYVPQQGPHQIVSPTSEPAAYWALSAGVLALGIVFLALSGYALLCLFRACRVRGGSAEQRPRFSMFMFALAMFIMLCTLFTATCSHH